MDTSPPAPCMLVCWFNPGCPFHRRLAVEVSRRPRTRLDPDEWDETVLGHWRDDRITNARMVTDSLPWYCHCHHPLGDVCSLHQGHSPSTRKAVGPKPAFYEAQRSRDRASGTTADLSSPQEYVEWHSR